MFKKLSLVLLIILASCTPAKYSVHCQRCTKSTRLLNYPQQQFHKTINKAQVKISKVEFKSLPENRGFWSGVMEGQGDCRLRVVFYENNRRVLTKHIGSRQLTLDDGPIWFKFNSAIPKRLSKNQSPTWKIESY